CLDVGTLALCCVDIVLENKLTLILPLGEKAIVGFKNVGTELLKIMNDKNKSFKDYFTPNQILCCKIKDREANEKGRMEYTVSISPDEVNLSLNPKFMQKYMIVQGFVNSVEDHGYTINIGFFNHIGFVKSSKDDLNFPKFGIFILLEDFKDGLRAIQMQFASLNDMKLESSSLVPSSLIPGTILKCQIKSVIKILIIRLTVKIEKEKILCKFDNYEINIPHHHMGSNEILNQGEDISVAIILSNQSSEVVYGSCIENIINHSVSNKIDDIKVGDILTVGFEYYDGLSNKYYKTNGYKFYEPIKSALDRKNKINKDEEIKARIIELNKFENIIKISTKKKTINQKFVSPTEVNVGYEFIGKIFKRTDKGYVVELSKNVNGFLYFFMMDAKQKYAINSSIKCRVFNIESTGFNQRILLTAKTELFKANCEIFPFSESDICVDKIVPGICVNFSGKGALFIMPFGHKSWITNINTKNDIIKVGTISMLQIKKLNISSKRHFATILDILNRKLQPGMYFEAKITGKSDVLHVEFLFKGKLMKGLIPKHHLNDNITVSNYLFEKVCSVGMAINCFLFEITKNQDHILSLKRIFFKKSFNFNSSRNIIPAVIDRYENDKLLLNLSSSITKELTFPVINLLKIKSSWMKPGRMIPVVITSENENYMIAQPAYCKFKGSRSEIVKMLRENKHIMNCDAQNKNCEEPKLKRVRYFEPLVENFLDFEEDNIVCDPNETDKIINNSNTQVFVN
ncbi:MAG: Protein RRP5, partial [Paramarteilia canceri]